MPRRGVEMAGMLMSKGLASSETEAACAGSFHSSPFTRLLLFKGDRPDSSPDRMLSRTPR